MKCKLRMIAVLVMLAVLLCCGAAMADEMPWSGSGTESDPWIITSKLELVMLHTYMVSKLGTEDKYWRLESDINAAEFGSLLPRNLLILSDLSEGGDSFDGTFDGNGHKITNLDISEYDTNYASLFGRIGSSGVVKNLTVYGSVKGVKNIGGIAGECLGTIQNCSFDGTVTSVYEEKERLPEVHVGGIVGIDGENALISDCTAAATVSGQGYVGGISGDAKGKYENCSFSGTVSATCAYAGGIVGITWSSALITGCHVSGNSLITGYRYVGGISGDCACSISQCSFSGTVAGLIKVGGIAGDADSSKQKHISECEAEGHVYALQKAGGITGAFSHGQIENCHFNGTVHGTDLGQYTYVKENREQLTGSGLGYTLGQEIGGIAGYCNEGGSLKDCEAEGSVIGKECTGGIVGQTVAPVTDCINRCDVNGRDWVGGIAGEAENTVTGCTNHGNVDGTHVNIGGIVGLSYGAVTGCENYGKVTTTESVAGGIVGNAMSGSISNCKNHGSVRVTSGAGGGGIVSICYITDITNCMNDGSSAYPYVRQVKDGNEGFAVMLWANNGTQENRIAIIDPEFCAAPECPFTYDEGDFVYWYTAVDGSGDTYEPDDSIPGFSYISAPKINDLYAYWMDNDTSRVSYRDADGVTRVIDAGFLNSSLTYLPGGYYCALDSVTLNSRLTVRGDVCLVLVNGTSIVASKGIRVPEGSSLTICSGYRDVQYGDLGTLTATGDSNGAAGIGGNSGESSGPITISGGIVTATGGQSGAGIGGGKNGSSGSLTIADGMQVLVLPGSEPASYGDRAAACRNNNAVVVQLCGEHSYRDEHCDYCNTPMSVSDLFEGYGSEGSPFLIKSPEDWNKLASLFNEDRLHNYSFTYKQMNSIAVSTMIGTEENPFTGTFDGNGKTLTVNIPASEKVAAPFRYIEGATIKNLHVAGTVSTNSQFAAGVAGIVKGGCTIQNCHVSATISSSVSGDGTHGGVAACLDSGCGLTMEGCVFKGSILGAGTNKCGGLVGWAQGSVTIRSCVFDPQAFEPTNSANFARGTAAIENCYYMTAVNNQGKQAQSVTAAEGVTIDFGTPAATYSVSGITAYPTGLKYGDVFYAGEGDTVALNPAAAPWEGYDTLFTASAGTMTASGSGWTLTMPAENTVISFQRTPGFATTPVVNLTFDRGTGGYHSYDGSEKLFDGLDNTKWCCAFNGDNWTEFHSDVPIKLTAYSMTTAGDAANYLRRNPVSWVLKGKKNATDNNWTVLATETNNNHLPAENCVEVFFPLTISEGYQYYHLEITAVQSGNQLQIAEFKLIGTPAFGTPDFTLPAALNVIEESAFEGLTAMTVLDARHCTTVGKWAFKGCTGLTELKLSKNCTIDPDAFTGCGTVYIFAPAGGSTEAYCNAHENCVFVEE